MEPTFYSALVAANSILITVVGFFLVRALKHVDEASAAQIELATEVKVLIANFQYEKAAFEKHEAADAREHERIRSDLEALSHRDHELANMVHGLYGTAQHIHGWDLPDPAPLSRRPNKKG